jgi:hypothetical protein
MLTEENIVLLLKIVGDLHKSLTKFLAMVRRQIAHLDLICPPNVPEGSSALTFQIFVTDFLPWTQRLDETHYMRVFQIVASVPSVVR